MKKNYVLIVLFILGLYQYVIAQEIEFTKETKVLVEKRDLYINGGTRAQFGGKSRTYIKIDLPPNTVQWYYSFSTTKGKSGTKNLNLAIQLASIITNPALISSDSASAIDVPDGEASADIYLLDYNNLKPFQNKTDFKYYQEGMAQNTKQAVVKIDDIKNGTWYLGIKNPSSLNGINLSIEVVAITETKVIKEKTEEQEKAELYGTLGWTKFENGEYEKCIDYCDKSEAEYSLGWVQANKGLANLMIGKETEAMEIYINAITLIKKQSNPNYVFNEIIKDINNALTKKPDLSGADDIKQVIELQMKKL